MIPLADINGPAIDYQGWSPLFAVAGGLVVVLVAGLLLGSRIQCFVFPGLTIRPLFAWLLLTM